MFDPQTFLDAAWTESSRAWFDKARERIDARGADALPVLFPALARTFGRGPLTSDPALMRLDDDGLRVDLSVWRLCDGAGLALIHATSPSDEMLVDLYLHGDHEEKTIVLRALGVLPITPATTQLLGEVQRTNNVTHFESAVCESNLAARACGRHGFELDDFNRLLLKVAFLDLRLSRVFDALRHANEELSIMVEGLATEREAAGRHVWFDTNRVIACAPSPASRDRLRAGLSHELVEHRLASAEALSTLRDAELLDAGRARLDTEPDDAVRAELERALAASAS